MANWTPEGHVGQMFKIISKYVPPSPLMAPPTKWGDETTVRDRLKNGISKVQCTRRMYPMRYPFPPAEVVDFFTTYYGPTNRAMAAIDEDAQTAMRDELVALWSKNNQAKDGTTDVAAEYLEVVAIKNAM